MDWLFDHWLEITFALAWLALQVNQWLHSRQLKQLQHDLNVLIVTNMPRDSVSESFETAWEDIGSKGRYLTDLGGMSIKMREQMYEQFIKALNTPITGAPAAGSVHDVMSDLDRWLTEQAGSRSVQGHK